jgi:hypothetical protein
MKADRQNNRRVYRKERTCEAASGAALRRGGRECTARNWQRALLGDVSVEDYERSSGGLMSQRTFADPNGTLWNVTAIQPQLTERRLSDRRSVSNSAVDFRAERRTEPDRRHQREVRAPVREGFERGWLVFDNGDEKRRFAPVPAGWEQMTAHELQTLCSRAKPAPQRWTRLVE